MATTTQIAAAPFTSNPLALWHLLSLDAPTVAALWTWFVARAAHIHLPFASPFAMAIAVWILYAADRLMDARPLDFPRAPMPELEARHLFHHRHRTAFLAGIACAALALAALIPHLGAAALHLYLLEGALLFAWFLILHATRSAHRLPKELAVGLFFSAAIFIPAVARRPALRLALLPEAVLFAALCSLNCLFIYAWEHDPALRPLPPSSQPAHPTTRLALRRLSAIAAAVAFSSAVLTLLDRAAPWPVPAACALSTVLLLLLDGKRRRLSGITLRAAADLALLTPLALLPFTR